MVNVYNSSPQNKYKTKRKKCIWIYVHQDFDSCIKFKTENPSQSFVVVQICSLIFAIMQNQNTR